MVTRAVLVDLDGTMIDTAPDIAAAANATLADLGLKPLETAQVRSFIGEGIGVLVRRSLGARVSAAEAETQFKVALENFERHYFATNGRYSSLYPGVLEGLRRMRDSGLKLACVTNKVLRFAEPLLARFALLEMFDTVIGGDSLPAKKPDPAQVLEACRRLGVAPAETVLIGDSAHDAGAARAAGVEFIAVPYGYGGKGELEGAASIPSLLSYSGLQ